jgi:lipopolysaccharide transport system ATP-binding protein
MNAAILGLSRSQVDERLDGILAFADIGDFIRQPVKTYSSGMFMRLAFAVATSVEPDILVIDEALSVGDGAFARKSFDRIMTLKDAGKTILFCSHSMYQVEALCSRALWIENGMLRMEGPAAEVTSAYQTSLNASSRSARGDDQDRIDLAGKPAPNAPSGGGRINKIFATVHGLPGREVEIVSGETDLQITLDFSIDPTLPVPSVAFGFSDANNLTVSSALSKSDGVKLQMDALGHGRATLLLPRLPLLKGRYSVTGFLACENAVHVYEQVEQALVLNVTQKGKEQGLVSLPHEWRP